MSEDIDTKDLKEDLKARKEEARRRHSFMEQVRSNWTLLASLAAAAFAIWNSYDGLRKEVARSTEKLSTLSTTVAALTASERTASERVVILETKAGEIERRIQTIEDWFRQTAPTPAGRRLDMPSPPAPKE